MAKSRGGQPGNDNIVRGKMFTQALRRALARAKGAGTAEKGLEKVAAKLVSAGMKGQQWAVREIADRIEGKPAQAITGPEGGPVELVAGIKVTIVDPRAGS